jgi:hypothetical protein
MGLAFSVKEAIQGNFGRAIGELSSGALSTIPGLGTAASLGIDAGLIADDIITMQKENEKLEEEIKNWDITPLELIEIIEVGEIRI